MVESSRHLRLYSLGLESIERKRELASQIETARMHDEMRDCIFQPSFYSNSSRSSNSDASPKLYSDAVQRMRRANAIRESVNQMLLPRAPMARSTKKSVIPRKPQCPQKSIVVEVTKDGPDSNPVLIGKLIIDRNADFAKIVHEFASSHELSPEQTRRLFVQVETAFKTYLN